MFIPNTFRVFAGIAVWYFGGLTVTSDIEVGVSSLSIDLLRTPFTYYYLFKLCKIMFYVGIMGINDYLDMYQTYRTPVEENVVKLGVR